MGLDIWFMKKTCKEVGYFRKVNFLVKYFEELGFDVENQIPFQISKENVIDLLNRCNAVLNDNSTAEILLPTRSGFFFGDTDYNEYYFDNVKEVKKFIEETLLPEFDSLMTSVRVCSGLFLVKSMLLISK